MDYDKFISSKTHLSGMFGFKPIWMPDSIFPFQEYGCDWLIRKGRGAGFFDTGLGKTLIELCVAYNIVLHTNRPVLILTPLAVAFQFIKEAEKFGIDEVEHSKDGTFKKKIVIANYERLHYFNTSDFEAVICDEASILKNFDGKVKAKITSFLKQQKYRTLATATPSPNDYTELGTSSEALGYLGYTDMLGMFFKNNEDTISPMSIGTKWRFKGHAKEKFFEWVASWSLSARKPSDLNARSGMKFSDEKYNLPPLNINTHEIHGNNSYLSPEGQMEMFGRVAKRQSDVRVDNRSTIEVRCQMAVELAKSHDTTVYWCHFNPEGDLLEKLDTNSVQLTGTMKLEKKEEILLAFAEGEIKKLITKPKISCFGLNWQHCGHTVYFPSFSYEQYYQAIRRFWRFGRTEPVTADIVYSYGGKRQIDSIQAKTKKADEMFSLLNKAINEGAINNKKYFNQEIQLPNFLRQ